jgi:hypothetical protein
MGVGVKFKISEKDKGLRKLFEQTVPELAKLDPHVRVGIFEDEKNGGAQHDESSPYTTLEIAAVHEFGAPEANIPERSFIRAGVNEKRPELVTLTKQLLKRVVEGKLDAKTMFDALGAQMVAFINAKVRQGDDLEPLKPATIARKGSSRPLIDKGIVLAALTWVTIFGEKKVGNG